MPKLKEWDPTVKEFDFNVATEKPTKRKHLNVVPCTIRICFWVISKNCRWLSCHNSPKKDWNNQFTWLFRASRGALGDLKQFPPWASTPKSIAWACRASHASDPQASSSLRSPTPTVLSKRAAEATVSNVRRCWWSPWYPYTSVGLKKSQPSRIEYSWDETSQYLVKKLHEFSDKSKIPKAKPDQSFREVWCVYTSRKRVTCYRLTS